MMLPYMLKAINRRRVFLILLLQGLLSALALSGCGGHIYHVVERGETLYSIGWVYGYDYRQVAQWNRIKPPYYLSPGQRLRVAPPAGQPVASLQEYKPTTHRTKGARKAAPVIGPSGARSSGSPASSVGTSPKVTSSKSPSSRSGSEARTVVAKVKQFFGSKTLNWRWPTKGRRISQTFSSNDPSRQGLDISGKLGSPIIVAAPGKVVYAGSGLASYGKLIIVKHNEKFLSAYAHNKKLHVKEGDVVKAGKKIADMGSVSANGNAGRARLHFEIRRNGKPVDPLRYLPRK